MLRFLIRRVGVAVAVALTVSVLTFGLANLASDPAIAMAGDTASAAEIQQIREQFGFDRPLAVQYVDWLTSAMQGDFGQSYRLRRPVSELIATRLPVTMALGGAALAFAIVLAIPMGVIAALRPNSWIDRTALTIAVFGQAMPTFWFALMMMLVFSVWLGWLPASGGATWWHFIMPAVALGYYATPAFMRLTRAGMLEVMRADYIRTARAKGLHPRVVVFKHALRNAIIPVVSLAAVQFGFMLGGSVVIETLFSMPGLGYLAWQSISRADLPVVQAIVLIIALIYVVLTLVADLLNAWFDPRVRLT
ncbi:MAG: ABC transporter permease [Alkalilacustris sp.]